MGRFLIEEWQSDLIQAWNTKNWFMKSNTLGDRLAPLLGAEPGSIVVGDTLSIKVFQAVSAGLALVPARRVILSDTGNFPSDLYMIEGLMKLRDAGYQLETCAPEALIDRITDDVAVVSVTEVDYRTARKHDMAAILEKAHSVGAVVVWDLAHSAGAIPVDLSGCDADFAVGCTYKFLNGGPGAPAFIYVAPRLHDTVEPTLSGWFAHADPFAFDLKFRPMPNKIDRMRIGTPSIAAFTLLEAALDVWEGISVAEVHEAAIALSDLFISEVEARCPGVRLASPRDPYSRGSHVSFHFADGYPCMQALIARGVIGDFRAPDIMRFGITPLYIGEAEILRAVDIWSEVLSDEVWRAPEYQTRAAVT
jgi:kynureninase